MNWNADEEKKDDMPVAPVEGSETTPAVDADDAAEKPVEADVVEGDNAGM